MRAKMTVAAADGGSQQLAIGRVELRELSPAAGADRDRGDDLDPVDPVLVDQAAQHLGLNRTEVHGHEGVRNDRQRALVVDRGHRVLN